MKLMLTIPDEFKNDFNKDHFADCFGRVLADISRYQAYAVTMSRRQLKCLLPFSKTQKRFQL